MHVSCLERWSIKLEHLDSLSPSFLTLGQGLSPSFLTMGQGLIWTWVHPPGVDTHSGMQLDPIKPAKPVSPSLRCPRRAGRSHPPSAVLVGPAAAQGSGAASGVQALHQQVQRSALARCRKTQFFLHALFFYISFYASPLVNAQFRACNQCRKESSPKSLGSLPCTLSFS